MRTHFDKPIAVVTGASSGIGYELAKQFAMHGFDLIVAAEDRAIEDIRPALEAFGANVEAVQVDLSSYIETEGFAADINALGLPISALALNAAISSGEKAIPVFAANLSRATAVGTISLICGSGK